jgi:hypothetical protein
VLVAAEVLEFKSSALKFEVFHFVKNLRRPMKGTGKVCFEWVQLDFVSSKDNK